MKLTYTGNDPAERAAFERVKSDFEDVLVKVSAVAMEQVKNAYVRGYSDAIKVLANTIPTVADIADGALNELLKQQDE